VYTDGDSVAHAEQSWPEGGGIMLGSYESGGECSREPGTGSVSVVTDNVDARYERVLDAGATVVRELADRDYGNRAFTVADPEGNLWSFGYYRGAPSRS